MAGFFAGLEYLSPPPPEKSILIDFTEEIQKEEKIEETKGNQTISKEIIKNKPAENVKKAESPTKGKNNNLAAKAESDEFGDVEKSKKQEEKINKNALFPSADNNPKKDTAAAHTAMEIGEKLKAGHASGNVKQGKSAGTPNAKLQGRTVEGALPKPNYTGQESGTVVVKIWVDKYGHVKKAESGYEGTTVINTNLWAAARKAAMNTRFNMSNDAPVLQEGTITYNFNLK